ncbi:hypothetical protein JOF53_007799 [Crossiella equi]|uniref:DUF4232 domain-containing protein n=1 Tax=Crossiella equi TaxID=130796 RepID=A0ABS5AQT6_9PSEU|nr:DUF4232 domain-containing protein [Crossiella equi]MBP2478927.1 hypothetical protein [Crossiella equi]
MVRRWVAALVVALGLTACGSYGVSPHTLPGKPSPLANGQPVPTTSGLRPGDCGARQLAFTRGRLGEARFKYGETTGFLGRVRNTGDRPCALAELGTWALLSATGRPMPSEQRFLVSATAGAVSLAPGEVALVRVLYSQSPFELEGRGEPCLIVESISFTPAGDTQALTVPLHDGVCDYGRINLTGWAKTDVF